MEYLIGLALAAAVAVFAAGLGFDRDRSFGPTLVIVVAAYYVLFALMGGSALGVEIAVASGFLLVAAVGSKTSPWIVAAAMVGHGLFDFVHGSLISNPGVPIWWPGFCGAFDVVFGGWMAVLLVRRGGKVIS